MTIAIGAMSLQSAKLQLINVAAMVASAVARGEPAELIDQLVATAGEQVAFELEELEDSICVKLSVAAPIAGILAAADALRGVSTGNPCIVAKDIASNSQLVLERCRIVGFEVFIETNMETLGIVHKARARAGPGE